MSRLFVGHLFRRVNDETPLHLSERSRRNVRFASVTEALDLTLPEEGRNALWIAVCRQQLL
ncbi:hypothetical protein D3C85_1517560 [compost metagenome]